MQKKLCGCRCILLRGHKDNFKNQLEIRETILQNNYQVRGGDAMLEKQIKELANARYTHLRGGSNLI